MPKLLNNYCINYVIYYAIKKNGSHDFFLVLLRRLSEGVGCPSPAGKMSE
jgi:hypothetical protein